jgi:hypothetical protein
MVSSLELVEYCSTFIILRLFLNLESASDLAATTKHGCSCSAWTGGHWTKIHLGSCQRRKSAGNLIGRQNAAATLKSSCDRDGPTTLT